MLGRSDGVLNPSGVRFGSSDIYAVLERCFAAEVAESICVGQRRPEDLDESVILFLLMRNGVKLDRALVTKIKGTVAKELTKRHVPKYVFEMPEVPVSSHSSPSFRLFLWCRYFHLGRRWLIVLQVTVNGKKVELPIKGIISGKTIKPSGTFLNPQSLDFFYQFQRIEELVEPQAKL